jgi:hypothetical protein
MHALAIREYTRYFERKKANVQVNVLLHSSRLLLLTLGERETLSQTSNLPTQKWWWNEQKKKQIVPMEFLLVSSRAPC